MGKKVIAKTRARVVALYTEKKVMRLIAFF